MASMAHVMLDDQNVVIPSSASSEYVPGPVSAKPIATVA
jgi:hypothetical protein